MLVNQRRCSCLVHYRNASLLDRAEQRRRQFRAATPEITDLAAEEFHPAVDFLRLSFVHWLELDALGAHPHQRRPRIVDEYFGEIGIAAILRDAPHVLEKIF